MAERDYLKTAKELEKERRKLLRNVMATIPDSLLILDRTLLIKTANRSFYKLFQVKPKEVIGRGITDVLGDEEGKLSAKLAALPGTKDRVENYELPYQSAKLGERIFNITARGIIVAEEEEEEEEEEELVVIRDITERKRAEEMLRRTEENFRRSLDDSPLGVRIVNSNGETTYANRAMLGIYGHASIEELKATPVKERYTPESYVQHLLRKEKRQRGEYVPSNYEVSIARKNGEIRHLEVFRKEVLWSGHTQFQVIYQDATERKQAEEEIRKIREYLQLQIDRMPIVLIAWNTDFRVTSWNPAAEKIFGFSSAEAQGKHPYDIIVPKEAQPHVDDIWRRLLEGDMTAYSVNENITKDGRTIICDWANTPLKDNNGRVIGVLSMVQDITERKLAEEALRQSESRYRLLAENVTDVIWTMDMNLRTTYVSLSVLQLRGYTAGEAITQTVKQVLSPASYETAMKAFAREMDAEKIGTRDLVRSRVLELEMMHKDGSAVWTETTTRLLRDLDGRAVGIIGVSRDITERKQAEEEIRRLLDRESQSAREWQETFDAVTDIVTLTSPHHELLRINRAGCEATGKKPGEIIGKKCYEVVHGLSAPIKECPCAEALKTKRSHTSELTEQGRHYLLTAYPIFGEGGEIVAFAHIIKDITGAKHAEEEKLELERKAHNASRLAAIGEMAAGIAHEINNPLTPILGFTEMLMKRELPEDAKSDLKIIYDSTRRTADVTRRLLMFARQSKPMRVLCDINEVIESTIQLRAYHLKTNNIKVVSELAPELPQTMAGAGQLQQVVLNLIINAEYEMTQSHGGGNLLIKTEKTGNITRVSIKDDGPGISRENMERLFTPFFTTKKVGEGTGLGLSVCHGIIAEHNGRIYAESKVGKGATFVVELPIVRQQGKKETKPSESDTVEAGEAVKAKILVVDDEPTIVQILKRVLTDEGYEVRATSKAKEALRLIEGGEYALILLDIKLPDMSGIELYQHLDKTAKPSAQKIIFITGDVMGADTMDFFSRTGAACITKPFEIEQLKKEVKSKLTPGGVNYVCAGDSR